MNDSITVRHCGDPTTLRAEAGTPLAPLLREAGLLTLPCGVGKCGKCLILAATEPCAEERALLGDAALASGLRLACYTRAAEGLDIALPQAGALRVLTRFAQSDYPFRPIVERRPFAMPEPSLDDQRSDLQRLIDACGAKGHALGLGQLAALPAFIRNARSNGGCGDGHGNVCGFGLMHGETLVGYTASDEADALIVDIGTTTVAALLVDTARRRVVAARGEHNAQSPYGADVISRIRHETEWEEHRNGPNPLQQAIAKQVSAMLAGLLEQAGIGDVDFLSLTGNTTMMHLLCGLPGEHIGKVPDQALYEHLRAEHPNDAVAVNTGDEDAIYTIQRYPLTMVSTDTGSYAPGEGHPQIAGSFPRYLHKMVIERGELSWEQAIYHTTLLPAETFGLSQKGRIRSGMDADLLVFNPETIRDCADFPGLGYPDAAPEGIRFVIVSGEIAAHDGKATDVMAGKPIEQFDNICSTHAKRANCK